MIHNRCRTSKVFIAAEVRIGELLQHVTADPNLGATTARVLELLINRSTAAEIAEATGLADRSVRWHVGRLRAVGIIEGKSMRRCLIRPHPNPPVIAGLAPNHCRFGAEPLPVSHAPTRNKEIKEPRGVTEYPYQQAYSRETKPAADVEVRIEAKPLPPMTDLPAVPRRGWVKGLTAKNRFAVESAEQSLSTALCSPRVRSAIAELTDWGLDDSQIVGALLTLRLSTVEAIIAWLNSTDTVGTIRNRGGYASAAITRHLAEIDLFTRLGPVLRSGRRWGITDNALVIPAEPAQPKAEAEATAS